jgi:hypothetical protein
MWDLGCGMWDVGCGIWDLGFGIWDLGFAFGIVLKLSRPVQRIVEGQPLPANGGCQHFKKSLRWLRFKCCGRAFPCPICHELDGTFCCRSSHLTRFSWPSPAHAAGTESVNSPPPSPSFTQIACAALVARVATACIACSTHRCCDVTPML